MSTAASYATAPVGPPNMQVAQPAAPTGASRKPNPLAQIRGKKEEAKLLEILNGWYSACERNRTQFERVWYTNMAFYFGRHYVQWASGTAGNYARLFEPPAPPWRVRLIVNKIKPIIRGELAKLTKERPQSFVIPSSTEEEDIIAAEASEAIFEHQMRELNFNSEVRNAIFWMCLCGTSFIKNWYDDQKVDSSGMKGSIVVEAVSPFHLYAPNMLETRIENQPYLIHAVVKDLEWASDRFGMDLSKEAQSSTSGSMESQLRSALGVNQQQNAAKNSIVIKECWVKPNPKFKEGLIVFFTSSQILAVKEGMYFKHGEFPFAKIDHIMSGKFYADSVIPDLIPLQKELNRTRSQIMESKNLMSKPQLMAPKGSVDARKLTSAPGQLIEYNPGFSPPQPLQLQNLPQYVIEELDRLQRDLDDISSQHEVSKGRTPPGVEAATAIAYLQEEDDSKMSPTVASIEEAVEKTGRHILANVVQFWDAQRQIKVLGADGAFESFILQGADVAGNIDLRVQAGSAAPRSKAAKQAFFMEIGKMGWVEPARILRYLEMAETGRLYEEINVDSRHAQKESWRIAAGQQLPVNSWDNHEVHVMEHNNFRKKGRFELLSEEVKMIFEQHVTMHQQLMQQQGMAQQAGPQMMGQDDTAPFNGQQPGGAGQSAAQPGPPPGGPPPQG